MQQPVGVYATGSGAVTADGNQIAETDLMILLRHALGGLHRSNSTTLAGGGHTTSIVNATSASNIVPGCLIAVESAAGSDPPVVRRVLAVSTLAITLDEELPFTPIDGDVIHGMATAYIDEQILVDSDGAGGPYTLSWLIQKGLPAALENWQLHGSKLQLDNLTLPRGDLPVLNGTIFAASFLGPGDAPSPSWSSAPTGSAPVAVGPRTEVQLGDYGDDTPSHVQVGEISVNFGVPVVVTETTTEAQANMEGVACYATQPADTTITLGIVPMASSWRADFASDTMKFLRWSRRGNAGQIFALQFPHCELNAEPKRGVQNAVSRVDLELRAHPDQDNSNAGNAALWTSKLLIGIG